MRREVMHACLGVPIARRSGSPSEENQIRPCTCVMFGELAAAAIRRQMLGPSGRSGHCVFHFPVFLHFLQQDADLHQSSSI